MASKQNPSWLEIISSGATIHPITGGAGAITVKAAVAGKRFIVFHVYLWGGAGDTVIFQSKPAGAGAAVNLSGTIAFTAAALIELKNSGYPIFKGNSIGDAFQITKGGAVANIEGFAVCGEIDI